MRLGVVALRMFGLLWLLVAGCGIAFGVWLAWSSRGSTALLELVNPLEVNFWLTWTIWAVALAPGIGARIWAARIEAKT